jgi:hypothetical protein
LTVKENLATCPLRWVFHFLLRALSITMPLPASVTFSRFPMWRAPFPEVQPMPTHSIDPHYPHWFRCDLCGQDVAEVLPAEALDLVNLTPAQVLELCPDAEAAIDGHEHWCPKRESNPMRALQVANGNSLVPLETGPTDDTSPGQPPEPE